LALMQATSVDDVSINADKHCFKLLKKIWCTNTGQSRSGILSTPIVERSGNIIFQLKVYYPKSRKDARIPKGSPALVVGYFDINDINITDRGFRFGGRSTLLKGENGVKVKRVNGMDGRYFTF
jgi:hypothetical protein